MTTEATATQTTTAPAPAPSSAPVASPAPTAAPVASPAPTAAPVASPAPTPAPTAAPVVYDLKLGADSPLDPSDVDKIAASARERGLSNEQAQAELDARQTAVGEFKARQLEQFEARKTEWATTTWADPELGGANKDATLANVKLVMDKFAPEGSGIRKELETTGYGNHPEFVRFVNSIGKAMREDTPVNGNGSGPGQKSAAQVLYGKT